MRWLGKITGAIIGHIAAGPFGLVLGLVIGQLYDLQHPNVTYRTQDQLRAQVAFFRATFSVMGHIAKADGHVSEDEIELAEHVMAQMKLSPQQKTSAIKYFTSGKQPGFSLETMLSELHRACNRQPMLLRMFIEIQMQAAAADGVLNPAEKRILQTICYRLGFAPFEFYQFYDKPHTEKQGSRARPAQHQPLDEHYRILGVSPNINDVELKKVYRRLMNRHHPDKLVSKGLPEEMLKLATKRTQEIKLAYDTIAKARSTST